METKEFDTIEDNNITWLDIFKKYKPDITEEEANYILWNETCFPFDTKTAIKQIESLYKSNNK